MGRFVECDLSLIWEPEVIDTEQVLEARQEAWGGSRGAREWW